MTPFPLHQPHRRDEPHDGNDERDQEQDTQTALTVRAAVSLPHRSCDDERHVNSVALPIHRGDRSMTPSTENLILAICAHAADVWAAGDASLAEQWFGMAVEELDGGDFVDFNEKNDKEATPTAIELVEQMIEWGRAHSPGPDDA
jgi:hypothetical protein